MPSILTSLNPDKALQYAPPKEMSLDNTIRLPTDWMEQLFQLITNTNSDCQLKKHVGEMSQYRAKTALLEDLKLVYCRLTGLFDQRLGALLNAERGAYLSKLSEGVMNCSGGFHARVAEVLFAMQKPERFEQLVHLAREVLVEETRIRFFYDSVHMANQVTIVASQAGFGVRARLLSDQYAGSHGDKRILEKLYETFSKKFTPYLLPDLISDQIRNVLHDQAYVGEKSVEDGGYNGCLIERFGKLIECFVLPEKSEASHFSYYANGYFTEKADYFLDVDWKKIRLLVFKKLVLNDFFCHLQPDNIVDFWMLWNFISTDFEIEKKPVIQHFFCEATIEATLSGVIDRLFKKEEFNLLNQAYQSSPEHFHYLIAHPVFVEKLRNFELITGLLHDWEKLDVSLQRLLWVNIREIKLAPESSWRYWLNEIKSGVCKKQLNKIKHHTACFILTAMQDVHYDALLKIPDDLRDIFNKLSELGSTSDEVHVDLIGNAFFKLLEKCNDISFLCSLFSKECDGELMISKWLALCSDDRVATFLKSLENLSEKLINAAHDVNFAQRLTIAAMFLSDYRRFKMDSARYLTLLNAFLEQMVELSGNVDDDQFIQMYQTKLNDVVGIYWIIAALLAVRDEHSEKVLLVTQRIARLCSNSEFIDKFFVQVYRGDTGFSRLMSLNSTCPQKLKIKTDVILQLLAELPDDGLKKAIENPKIASLFASFCYAFTQRTEGELNELIRILQVFSTRKFDGGQKLLDCLIEISDRTPFDYVLRICFFKSDHLGLRNASTLAVFQNLFNLYPECIAAYLDKKISVMLKYYSDDVYFQFHNRVDNVFNLLAFFSGCQFSVAIFQQLVDVVINKRELLLTPMREYLKRLNTLPFSNAASIQHICRRETVLGTLIDYVALNKIKSSTGVRQLVDKFILAKLTKGSAPYLAVKLTFFMSEKMVSLKKPSFFCASAQLSRDEMQDFKFLSQLTTKIADGRPLEDQEKNALQTLSKKLESYFPEKNQTRLLNLCELCCEQSASEKLQMN